jgi:RNA polymerase sigma-70 factor (ECF subfamily)
MQQQLDYDAIDDSVLVRRASENDVYAIREITTRNNQRLFRAAWSVLRNHADAEDVVQEAYLKAFRALHLYEGISSLSTWLTRIAVNAALDRKRAADRRKTDLLHQDVAMLDEYRARYAHAAGVSPESALARKELARLLTASIAELPEDYRTVFVLREIEGMSVRDTATALELSEDVVKTRMVRSRRRLRDALSPEIQSLLDETISFAGADCEAMTARVLSALGFPDTP